MNNKKKKEKKIKSFLGGCISFCLVTLGGPSEILLMTPKMLIES
jgi:hypothetical protein